MQCRYVLLERPLYKKHYHLAMHDTATQRPSITIRKWENKNSEYKKNIWKKKLFQIEKSMEENRCKKSKRNSIIFCWMSFLLLFFPAVTLVIDSNLITECAVHWSLLTITNFYKFYWKINFIEKKKSVWKIESLIIPSSAENAVKKKWKFLIYLQN